MAEQDKGYSGPLGIDIAPNGSGILSEHWEQKDIRKILNGEISSTQEDLTHLREYVLQLSIKAHATLSDPDSLAELHTYGYTVTRKDGNLPRTNKHILISPTDSDTFPSLELTHR